jgi:hypothetical protein
VARNEIRVDVFRVRSTVQSDPTPVRRSRITATIFFPSIERRSRRRQHYELHRLFARLRSQQQKRPESCRKHGQRRGYDPRNRCAAMMRRGNLLDLRSRRDGPQLSDELAGRFGRCVECEIFHQIRVCC